MPMLPELADPGPTEPAGTNGEFSSADAPLDLDGTIALLQKHQLMVDQVNPSRADELLAW
jgi:hypothetical protein